MNTDTPSAAPEQPDQTGQDYSKPVAYDSQGQPLYARPPENATPAQPQIVYMARPMDPAHQQIPPEIQAKVDESHRLYPHLNLSDGEYVITAIKRHPIGLIQIWGTMFLFVLVLLGLYAVFFANPDSSPFVGFTGDSVQISTMAAVILGAVIVMAGLGGWAATYIYNGNRFYLTNESVIQEIQTSLFSRNEQTVSLSNIEDASYKQNGPIQLLLSYGSIRLSTQGDETTYRFTYVTNPKKHIATLNNAVEAFKNGRPIH